MSEIRDYIRELFTLLAEGKTAEFSKEGQKALTDIAEAVTDLQKQATIIQKAIARLSAQRPLPLKVEIPRAHATGLDDSQRRVIKETAIEVASQNRNAEITVNEVIQNVNRKGVKLTVSKPSAVVASMLSKWTKEFTKIEKGRYRLSSAS